MLDSDSYQFVVFRLGKEVYGFDVGSVREIHDIDNISTVHRSASYIEGVMNLRGKLVTVVNLRKRFGMEAIPSTENTKIIVIDAPDAPVGFIVDEVTEVARVGKEAIEPAPSYVTKGIESEYLIGIAKHEDRLITIIDPFKVLELSCDADSGPGRTKHG